MKNLYCFHFDLILKSKNEEFQHFLKLDEDNRGDSYFFTKEICFYLKDSYFTFVFIE